MSLFLNGTKQFLKPWEISTLSVYGYCSAKQLLNCILNTSLNLLISAYKGKILTLLSQRLGSSICSALSQVCFSWIQWQIYHQLLWESSSGQNQGLMEIPSIVPNPVLEDFPERLYCQAPLPLPQKVIFAFSVVPPFTRFFSEKSEASRDI